MSESTRETVRRIAALARLEVAPAEEAELARQFGRILEHFERLARLELDPGEAGADPARPAEQRRADEPRPGLTLEQALRAAPAREGPFYRVPKTVGGEG
jgi:aspartyl-tRNA(Asn)/glutamyl-tRNA(Gln) amidotransferase subunit C